VQSETGMVLATGQITAVLPVSESEKAENHCCDTSLWDKDTLKRAFCICL